LSAYKRTGMNIWLKVTQDKYELPVAVADSSEELARMCGVTASSIHSSMSHAKDGTRKTPYRKVRIKFEN